MEYTDRRNRGYSQTENVCTRYVLIVDGQKEHLDGGTNSAVVCSVGSIPKYAGRVCSVNTLPNYSVRFGTASIPYRTRQTGKVRYETDTDTRHFGKFGTTSIPVPDTWGTSVRPPYRYVALQYGYTGGIHPTEVVRYGLNTLPNTPVWFGTNSMPVPDTSVCSVRL